MSGALTWAEAKTLEALRAKQAARTERQRDAEARDRAEWIEGIRRRLGLVTEVHHCRVWQIGEHWWAWACRRTGCYDADWQHTANSERTRAAAWAKASAHSRRFKPSPPEPAPGAGLDLTGFGAGRP